MNVLVGGPFDDIPVQEPVMHFRYLGKPQRRSSYL